MPIPSHLVDCLVLIETSIDEAPLDADVRCPCGSKRFEVLFPGETWRTSGAPCTAEIDGNFFSWSRRVAQAVDGSTFFLMRTFTAGMEWLPMNQCRQRSLASRLSPGNAHRAAVPNMRRQFRFKPKGRRISSRKRKVRSTRAAGRTLSVASACGSSAASADLKRPTGSSARRCSEIQLRIGALPAFVPTVALMPMPCTNNLPHLP
jgi:hypothetical protein